MKLTCRGSDEEVLPIRCLARSSVDPVSASFTFAPQLHNLAREFMACDQRARGMGFGGPSSQFQIWDIPVPQNAGFVDLDQATSSGPDFWHRCCVAHNPSRA